MVLCNFRLMFGSAAMVSEPLYPCSPNMVNEHLTTKWAERVFPASNPARKINDKNHFAAKLNWPEITTERHWGANQNCSGLLDFLGRQEIVEIEI